MLHHKTIAIALISFIVLGSSPIQAAIFEMNCGVNGSAFPLCGFDATPGSTNLGTTWNRRFILGGGPNGRDAVEIELLPRPPGPRGDSSSEGYYGWVHDVVATVPQGQTRYIRLRLKLVGPIRYISNAQNTDGSLRGWGAKMIILGDGCEDFQGCQSNRTIINLEKTDASTSVAQIWFDKNISGVGGLINPVTPDVWHSIQVKIQSSSTASATDGRISFYYDGDNASEATPTTQSQPISMDTAIWDSLLALGYYGHYMAAAGHVVYQFAGFEYDNRFDPQWHTSGTPPTNPCDLNGGGVSVVDVQLCANQAIGVTACTTGNIDGANGCNVVDVQRVVNSALGGPCVAP